MKRTRSSTPTRRRAARPDLDEPISPESATSSAGAEADAGLGVALLQTEHPDSTAVGQPRRQVVTFVASGGRLGVETLGLSPSRQDDSTRCASFHVVVLILVNAKQQPCLLRTCSSQFKFHCASSEPVCDWRTLICDTPCLLCSLRANGSIGSAFRALWACVVSVLTSTFLPFGFPHTVAPEYATFQVPYVPKGTNLLMSFRHSFYAV